MDETVSEGERGENKKFREIIEVFFFRLSFFFFAPLSCSIDDFL
jgi:hypothetical protein